MLVVVLGVLLEPPAPARADLRVLRQAAQLVLGGVHDHFCVEDRLTAWVERGIQVGHPAWVGGHLHRHWFSFQGANEKIDNRPAGGKCTTSPPPDKFMGPWKVLHSGPNRCEGRYPLG